jgi:hypothetical protein
MRNSRCVTKTVLVGIAMLLATATSWAQKPPIAEQVAKGYGPDWFGQIEAIRYTCSIDFPGFKVPRTVT